MNFLATLVAAYVAFALELGLRQALALGGGNAAPSFVFALAIVIAVAAPPGAVLWTFLLFGLLTDLTWPQEAIGGVRSFAIVGPYALGYLVAAQFVLSMRALIIRRNPLSLAFLCGVGYLVAQVVVVALLTFRSSYTPIEWNPTQQLLWRGGGALYTAMLGLLIGLIAGPLTSALGLHQPPQRRSTRALY